MTDFQLREAQRNWVQDPTLQNATLYIRFLERVLLGEKEDTTLADTSVILTIENRLKRAANRALALSASLENHLLDEHLLSITNTYAELGMAIGDVRSFSSALAIIRGKKWYWRRIIAKYQIDRCLDALSNAEDYILETVGTEEDIFEIEEE